MHTALPPLARPKDTVAAMRKRFTSNTKNFHIVNLTLTVSCSGASHMTRPFVCPLERCGGSGHEEPTFSHFCVLQKITYIISNVLFDRFWRQPLRIVVFDFMLR